MNGFEGEMLERFRLLGRNRSDIKKKINILETTILKSESELAQLEKSLDGLDREMEKMKRATFDVCP